MPNSEAKLNLFSFIVVAVFEVDDLWKRVGRAIRANAYGFFEPKYSYLSGSGDRVSWFIVLVKRIGFWFTNSHLEMDIRRQNHIGFPPTAGKQTQTRKHKDDHISFHYANEFCFGILWRFFLFVGCATTDHRLYEYDAVRRWNTCPHGFNFQIPATRCTTTQHTHANVLILILTHTGEGDNTKPL